MVTLTFLGQEIEKCNTTLEYVPFENKLRSKDRQKEKNVIFDTTFQRKNARQMRQMSKDGRTFIGMLICVECGWHHENTKKKDFKEIQLKNSDSKKS